MTTVVVLMDDQVQIALGRPGKKPKLRELYHKKIIGAASNLDPWYHALKELWEAHKLPKKHIRVVLPSDAAMLKVLTAPNLQKKAIAPILESVSTNKDGPALIADYTPLGLDDEKHYQILTAAAPLEEMQGYADIFHRLGVTVESMTVPTACLMSLKDSIPVFQDKCCIWMPFESFSVATIVLDRCRYYYSGRNHIFSEPGTLDFGTEIQRNVSGIQQFWSTEAGSGNPITHLYYSGCPKEDFEPCQEGLKNLGLVVEPLPDIDAVRLPQGFSQNEWIYCLGAMMN